MKRKTLLSILAASTIGCIGPAVSSPYEPIVLLEDPYTPTANESQVAANIYKRQEERCLRSHYMETEGNQLRSFLVTEHCVSGYGASGTFLSKRFKDSDTDGVVDLVCETSGNTYVGKFEVSEDSCVDAPSQRLLLEVMRVFLYRGSGQNPPLLDETYQELYQQK